MNYKFLLLALSLSVSPSLKAEDLTHSELSYIHEKRPEAARALVAGYRNSIIQSIIFEKACKEHTEKLRKYLSISNIIQNSKASAIEPELRNNSVLQFVFNLAAITCHGSIDNYINYNRKEMDELKETLDLIK